MQLLNISVFSTVALTECPSQNCIKVFIAYSYPWGIIIITLDANLTLTISKLCQRDIFCHLSRKNMKLTNLAHIKNDSLIWMFWIYSYSVAEWEVWSHFRLPTIVVGYLVKKNTMGGCLSMYPHNNYNILGDFADLNCAAQEYKLQIQRLAFGGSFANIVAPYSAPCNSTL